VFKCPRWGAHCALLLVIVWDSGRWFSTAAELISHILLSYAASMLVRNISGKGDVSKVVPQGRELCDVM